MSYMFRKLRCSCRRNSHHFSRFGLLAVPDILIRCSITGNSVKTGLTTESIRLESLGSLELRLKCSACKKIHKWRMADAWVDRTAQQT